MKIRTKLRSQEWNTRYDFYVYSILDKDGKCIYIGKGSGNRVLKSLKNKQGYSYIILVNGVNHRKALDLERSLISQIGIDNLVNVSN